SGRPAELPGVESIAGLFINTLPVRMQVAPGEPLVPWLEQIQARQAELQRYEYSPLDQVRKWSGLPAGQALFDHILVCENYPVASALRESPPGLEIIEAQPREQTNYPLTVVVLPGAEMQLGLHYDSRRFDRVAILRMAGHLENLLRAFVDDPRHRLAELALLTAAERHQLLVDWNDTTTADSAGLIHERFARQAARMPEATAVVFEDQRLSYRELDRRANQLADSLRRLGVGPEVLVGVLMERSSELVVGVLGILKAGGAYLPLEPSYPRERLAFMVSDARAPILLTQERLRDRAPEGPQVLTLGLPEVAAETAAEAVPGARVDSNHLAYVIYTSGSTGRPKGVMVPHRGVVNYLRWCVSAYDPAIGNGVPLHSSIAFDMSVTSLLGPLVAGDAVLLVADDEGGGQDLATVLDGAPGFSFAKLTPSHLEVLARTLPPQSAARAARALILGGEALSWGEALAFWRRNAPGTRLINEYGPTETVVGCCVHELLPEARPQGSVPIGRPIANTGIFILDRHGVPVPAGVAGELYIAGVGLARGYMGRAQLTAVRFVPNPFAETPGERLYRTGDETRWRPDGNLEYLGRLDLQVKIRGFRIELGEIEAVLGRHPAVQEVVVVARQQEATGARRLVAYVVAVRTPSGQVPTVGELQGFIKEKLPAYMVPSAFVFRESVPLMPSGKVDRAALSRQALPAPEGRDHLGSAFMAPGNPTEKVLAQIWAEVLDCGRVGVNDNFFELGGDSILSLRIVSRAREAGLRLSPRDVFRHPTIAGLAAVGMEVPIAQVEQGPVTGRVPLSPIQRWFLDRNPAAPDHFNQALLLELREALDPPRLAMALGALLEHHDALRLRLFRQGSEWRQINAGVDGEVPLLHVDLAALPEGGQRAALEAVAAEVQGSLNLSRGPLLRMAL
ncbi:MAG: amino acid adenylation domain-containing protein, partial [bacterium]|nr:amino acid adenylation domain-containing protein [bacterium]